MHTLLSRRNILKSSALAAFLAPVLRRTSALAAGTPAPRRVIFIYSPNGPMVVTGPASGTETAFTFHDWWSPLQRHQADGIFLSNLSCTGASVVPGPSGLAGGHGLGGQTFTGAGTIGDGYTAGGESIDQTIGKRLESQNRAGVVRSVAWGIDNAAMGGFWASSGVGIVPETSPTRAWQTLFANFTGGSTNAAAQAAAAAAMARKKSILDFVLQDCTALKSALGTEGTRILDDHCTTVRSMEQNLMVTVPSTGDCAAPANPGATDWSNPDNVDAQMKSFIDLIAMSLACELTHVVAFQFGPEAARNRLAASYGVPSSPTADSGDSGPAHHPWTHQNLTLSTTQSAIGIFMKFYASQVALLVDKLKSTNDSSGKPLLDSTAVLWLSELGGTDTGFIDPHITGSVPAVLLGSGQGTFKTGRYIQGPSYGGDPGQIDGGRMSAQLLVSMAQYMGLSDVTTVGVTGVSGPLSALYG
jgi:hypothetical protein